MLSVAVLRHAGDGSNSISGQLNDFTRAVAWTYAQAFNDKLGDDILRRHVMSQFSSLPVDSASSAAAQCNDMNMVDVWQISSVF